jgi:CheY-like chemotaxis protein
MTTVLIVDDDPKIRYLLRMALEDEEYLLLEAGNGVEALEVLLATSRRAVVVLDHLMPELDGCTLLERLAALPPSHASQAQYSFILCSALNPETLIARCAPLHVRLQIQFVAKPFAVRDMLSIIKRAALGLEQARTKPNRQIRQPVDVAAAKGTRNRLR